ncbi:unnamed protein product [Sphagnum troendelagicum]|uniref:Uncharacterized protein n=1 Tax=Sphagnum troendelagicum TaxID=128251 RepID=A0ABP0U7S8_9BRYO
MDTSENTGEFENPASTHTPQNYTCSTLTSGGSRKAQAVSNKYRMVCSYFGSRHNKGVHDGVGVIFKQEIRK